MKLRRGRLFALVVVVAMVALVVRHERSQSDALGPPPVSLAGYRVVYRVAVHAQGDEVTRREVEVRRPSNSRDLAYGENGTDPVAGFVSVGTRLYGLNGGAVLDYGDRVASVPPADFRFAPIVSDLVRLHLARRIGSKIVADRRCDEYRTGAPLGDPIKAEEPGEHTDLCIDRFGLVLSERWVLKGALLRETTATDVDLKAPATDLFAPPGGERKLNPSGVGVVKALSVSRVPDTGLPYWVAPAPLWDFKLAARDRAISTNTTSGSPEVTDIVYVDSYRRGHDTIEVLHREASASGPARAGVEQVHDVGRLGTGEVALSGAGTSISFTAGKWIVTVRGPFDVAHVRAFAATLRIR